MPPDKEDFSSKIHKWLSNEGYPLEYYAAHILRAAGLFVQQGHYTRDDDKNKRREVDVVADLNYQVGDRIIRISNIVECKWSGEKPIVLFTAARKIAASAGMCQAICNETADALLWLLRDNTSLHKLQLFDPPDAPGFGGRQAFSDNDMLYRTFVSVVQACASFAERADPSYIKGNIGNIIKICLPIVVVDGHLFEAGFDPETNQMRVDKASHIRCYWRGSPDRYLMTAIDIVTRDGLKDFAEKRKAECLSLALSMTDCLDKLITARKNNDDSIALSLRQPTGRSRAPEIIVALYDSAQYARRRGYQVP